MTLQTCEPKKPVCLVQFAKVPKLGYVKTRTTPGLTDALALQLHQCLMRYTWSTLSHGAWDYRLYLSESGYDDQIRAGFSEEQLDISYQASGDLGRRMHHSFKTLLEQYDRVIVIGSDCPYLTASHIAEVDEALRNYPCVLTPAQDGGYVLIGLSQVSESLFQGVPWGSEKVLECTEEKLRDLAWRYRLMSPLPDIDTTDDLRQLVDHEIGPTVLSEHYADFVSRLSVGCHRSG